MINRWQNYSVCRILNALLVARNVTMVSFSNENRGKCALGVPKMQK
ncbi:hypothetical protein HMPREF9442_02350 [Paraprevotella xylaniphila YIT 11841]|uniref:Uncharacterized protein n=1 Tax=Paraprevotella xylaniphila YIT 11841 TaxID=762982 RepID=F3QVP7_9BACT|nr:hypothetical protein HMPREF9442_02350 [Paraprevotella xylaniphila YIT 11841]